MAAPILTNQVPQGIDSQQINQRSTVVFINGFAIVPNDTNDKPQELLSGIGEDALIGRLRSNGTLVIYNPASSSWVAPSPINNIDKFTDISESTADGFYNILDDDSSGGDGNPSLYWVHRDSDNNLLKTYIVSVDK